MFNVALFSRLFIFASYFELLFMSQLNRFKNRTSETCHNKKMARTQSNENLAAGISLFFRFLQILAAFFCSARDGIWLSGRIYWSVSSQSSQDKSLSQRLHGLDVYSSFFRYFCLFYLTCFAWGALNHRDRSIQLRSLWPEPRTQSVLRIKREEKKSLAPGRIWTHSLLVMRRVLRRCATGTPTSLG